METQKWYLIQGTSQDGNYAFIKCEITDKVVASFPPVNHTESNKRIIDLREIVDNHNKTVKLLKKYL